jgi:hypothetical protein
VATLVTGGNIQHNLFGILMLPHGQRATYTRKRSKQKLVLKKTIPLQAWRGPEGSRRLRLPDFKTIDT